MKHSQEGVYPKNTITIQESDDVCIIDIKEDGYTTSITLDVDMLYNFIGTALHVQQRLKQR